jgi:hypothetical protein
VPYATDAWRVFVESMSRRDHPATFSRRSGAGIEKPRNERRRALRFAAQKISDARIKPPYALGCDKITKPDEGRRAESIHGGRIARGLNQALEVASGIKLQVTRHPVRAICIALTPPRKAQSS